MCPVNWTLQTWDIMENQLYICSGYLLNSTVDDGHVFTANIAVIITNFLLSIFGTFLNLLIIASYVINNRLRASSNMLLVALAFSDLTVTMIVQPIYVVAKVNEVLGNYNCLLLAIMEILTYFCCGTSLITIAVLSVERFINLAYPFRCQSITSPARLKVLLGLSWFGMFIFSITGTVFQITSPALFQILGCIIIVINMSIVVAVWIWIWLLVRQQKNKIKSSQETCHMTNYLKSQQNTKTSFLIIAVVLFCYFPIIFINIYYFDKHRNFSYIYLIDPWCYTTGYANSALNPLLLFWRRKAFRETAKSILCSVERVELSLFTRFRSFFLGMKA